MRKRGRWQKHAVNQRNRSQVAWNSHRHLRHHVLGASKYRSSRPPTGFELVTSRGGDDHVRTTFRYETRTATAAKSAAALMTGPTDSRASPRPVNAMTNPSPTVA